VVFVTASAGLMGRREVGLMECESWWLSRLLLVSSLLKMALLLSGDRLCRAARLLRSSWELLCAAFRENCRWNLAKFRCLTSR
jgi:hypothetical protein